MYAKYERKHNKFGIPYNNFLCKHDMSIKKAPNVINNNSIPTRSIHLAEHY